jgi:DNA-binding Xre family transcriptional regulator
MLVLDLADVLAAKGVSRPVRFLMRAGIPRTTAHRLLRGSLAKLDFVYITLLCDALYCTPNELLNWKPRSRKLSKDHPLLSLQKTREPLFIDSELRDVRLNKLPRLAAFIQSLRDEADHENDQKETQIREQEQKPVRVVNIQTESQQVI